MICIAMNDELKQGDEVIPGVTYDPEDKLPDTPPSIKEELHQRAEKRRKEFSENKKKEKERLEEKELQDALIRDDEEDEIINDHRNFSDSNIYNKCLQVMAMAKKGHSQEDIMAKLQINEKHPAFVGLTDTKTKKTRSFYQKGRFEFKDKFLDIILEQVEAKDEKGGVKNPALVNNLVKAIFVKNFNPTVQEALVLKEEGMITENNIRMIDPIIQEKEERDKEDNNNN